MCMLMPLTLETETVDLDYTSPKKSEIAHTKENKQ